MFQALTNLFWGEVEDVAAEVNGPNPLVTEADEEGWMMVNIPEGATAETSPMEDLLIEHTSMSVYVSPSNTSLSILSNSHLSTVAEETASLVNSVSRVTEQVALPASRVTRGAAAQVGPLAKVTQVARIQRGKGRAERRMLGRNALRRQNRTMEAGSRHGGHARHNHLHQPIQRKVCH